MTDDRIEAKALALVNEVGEERMGMLAGHINREITTHEALCRAIEQHEAFRQEVSDIVGAYVNATNMDDWVNLKSLIITEPDPIAEAWIEATGNTVGMEPLNAALEARGLEIREKSK